MKFTKYILFLFFIFQLPQIHSQYLDYNDISIFKNTLPNITSIFDIIAIYENDYFSSFNETVDSFTDFLNANDNIALLEEKSYAFKIALENLMKSETLSVPYDTTIWTNNGPQKYVTIFWGAIIVEMQNRKNKFSITLEQGGFWYEERNDENIEFIDDFNESIARIIEMYDIFIKINIPIFHEDDLKIIKKDNELSGRVYELLLIL